MFQKISKLHKHCVRFKFWNFKNNNLMGILKLRQKYDYNQTKKFVNTFNDISIL